MKLQNSERGLNKNCLNTDKITEINYKSIHVTETKATNVISVQHPALAFVIRSEKLSISGLCHWYRWYKLANALISPTLFIVIPPLCDADLSYTG